ncbi:hypothetical protein QEH42_gp204 [Microbacterium phage Pumpernickel]|uniref:Uncharacterized protein n=1 Tax=Microbacterium phage Pumpernickel TaxID=2885983 RepID=A0AAE8Y7A7_9CAUD|nr:hypothetical protein QEH42_gp204 [Microbacterium phage Pumpernickel]UDL16014.1 hypothetical protein SEA_PUMPERNICKEL_264 [Microbacterium phage Pumpernickel]
MTEKLEVRTEYICEVCDKVEVLTEDEAYDGGWDYPPFMGIWGVVSPRTCGGCGIQDTLWWKVMMENITDSALLSEQHLKTLERIKKEDEEHNG